MLLKAKRSRFCSGGLLAKQMGGDEEEERRQLGEAARPVRARVISE